MPWVYSESQGYIVLCSGQHCLFPGMYWKPYHFLVSEKWPFNAVSFTLFLWSLLQRLPRDWWQRQHLWLIKEVIHLLICFSYVGHQLFLEGRRKCVGTPCQVCPLLLPVPHHRCLSAGYSLRSFLYPYHHGRRLDALLHFGFFFFFHLHSTH